MKFATALLASFAAAASTSPNERVGNGTMRMKVDPVRTEFGGLTSIIRDENFRLDSGNQSYLFADPSVLWATEKTSYR